MTPSHTHVPESLASAEPSVLNDRRLYQPCHIYVPDVDHRLSAIRVNDTYFSFFRSEKSYSRALEIATRMQRKGDRSVITKTPKTYAIWALETQAQLAKPGQQNSRR
jgi:hypothetical protein